MDGSSSINDKDHTSRVKNPRNLQSLLGICDPATTENSIIHTGKESIILQSLAASNPDDGHLTWATSESYSFDNSIYIPTSSDACKGLGFHEKERG